MPPLTVSAYTGSYGSHAYGPDVLRLEGEGEGEGAAANVGALVLTVGPITTTPLSFSKSSLVREQPCGALSAALSRSVAPWARAAVGEHVGSLAGICTMVEWLVPAEIPKAGISAANRTVAFPWGCGPVPLPDGPSIYTVSHGGRGVLVVMMAEVFVAAARLQL